MSGKAVLGGFNNNSVFAGNRGGGGVSSWRHPNFDHGNWNRWRPGWDRGCNAWGCSGASPYGYGWPSAWPYSWPYYAYAYAPSYAAVAYTVPVAPTYVQPQDVLVYSSTAPFVAY